MRNLLPIAGLCLLSMHAAAQSTTLTINQAINQTLDQATAQVTTPATTTSTTTSTTTPSTTVPVTTTPVTTTPQTLAQQQQAAAAAAAAIQSMQSMTLAQQQAFALAWAKAHPTAFIPAAVVNSAAVNQAYGFRGNMSGDPQCATYGQQADTVFLDAKLDQNDKLQQLKQINQQVNSANCGQ